MMKQELWIRLPLATVSLATLAALSACASIDNQHHKGYAFTRARELANHVGVRPSLASYVVKRESNGRMNAANPSSSARGPMQVIDGTAAEIAGRNVSRAERMTDTGIKLGVAYLAACQRAMPNASDHAIWRGCFYRGHASVGASMDHARAAFKSMFALNSIQRMNANDTQ